MDPQHLIQYIKMLNGYQHQVGVVERTDEWDNTKSLVGKEFTQKVADRYNMGGLAWVLAKLTDPERPDKMDMFSAITHMHLAKEFQMGFENSKENAHRTLDLCL